MTRLSPRWDRDVAYQHVRIGGQGNFKSLAAAEGPVLPGCRMLKLRGEPPNSGHQLMCGIDEVPGRGRRGKIRIGELGKLRRTNRRR